MKKNVQFQSERRDRMFGVAAKSILMQCSLFLILLLTFGVLHVNGQTEQGEQAVGSSLNNEKLIIDTVASICQGEIFNNTVFEHAGSFTGYYVDVYGDTLNYQLTVHPHYHTQLSATICAGENYTENGFNLTAPTGGFYDLNLTTVHGCDSLVTLHLQVSQPANPHIFGISNGQVVCDGERTLCRTEEENHDYNWVVFGGTIIAPVDAAGNPKTDSTWVYVEWSHAAATTGATISVTYKNSNMCAGTTAYNLNVTLPESATENYTATICEGENYVEHGFYLFGMTPGVHDTTIYEELPPTPEHPCGTVVTKHLVLTVEPTPVAVIVPADTTIYAQQTVQLCVQDPQPGVTYTWSWENGGSATGQCITVAPMKNTTYTVTAVSEAGCWDISLSAIVRVLTYFDNPSNLIVEIGGDCQPHIAWEAPDTTFGFGRHLGYNIYRDNVLIGFVPATQLHFVDERIIEGSYLYCVTAVYTLPYDPTTQVESVPSCYNFVFSFDPVEDYFPAPQNPYAYPSYDCSVVVIWDAPETSCWGTLVGYNVYRILDNNPATEKFLGTTDKLIFVDYDVHYRGIKYTYYVEAIYVDFDNISSRVSAETDVDCGLAINIYPNPGNDKVTVVANEMDYIKIYTTLGQYVTTQQVPSDYCHEVVVPTIDWENGVYLFKIYFRGEDKEPITMRVSVVHW